MRRRAILSGVSCASFTFAVARAQSALGTVNPPGPAALSQAAPPPFSQAAPPPFSQAARLDDIVSPDYQRFVIARWGDGVLPGAPEFTPGALTAGQADTQFPYDAVIAGLVAPPPAQDGIPRLVMVLGNPDAPARMVFPGGLDQPVIAGKLQGATVMNLQYLSGRWLTEDGGYQSRRIADGDLCQISGPAAAAIGSTVQGMLAPQAGCATLWATSLLAEGDAAAWLARLAGTGLGYADPADAPRFGWVVELNPLDPGAFPVKRTSLGRFARAGIAATATPDGRAVIFMSQDDDAGMFFRFIAATNATDGTMLDSGMLAVAQIQDGQINWVNLAGDSAALIGALGTAQTAGGSVFDAPGGIAIAGDGTVYLACGGNPARDSQSTNALNPRAGDDNGHIIAFHPPNGDVTAATFAGAVAIAAGNPATAQNTQYAPGSAWFRKPRTLNVDGEEIWIGTDQDGEITDTADGMFVMQTGGPARYQVTMAYLAPIGAAMGGAAFDPAVKTVFAMVRHPGATPAASFDAPATRWPSLQPGMPPQSTLIALVGV